MKRSFAVLAGLFFAPAAYANTPCDAPASANLPNGLVFANLLVPPGNYPIVPSPTSGRPSIRVGNAIAGTIFYIPITQLAGGPGFSISASTPLQTSCGSPDSPNFQAVADGLDMDFDFDVNGDSDTIGGAVTGWKVANEDGQRFDLKYSRGIRLGEGSRTRLVITVPARYLRVDSTDGGIGGAHGGLYSFSAGLGVGVQVPVSRNWWLTPRVSYTATTSSAYLGGNSELLAATLASNLRIPVPGRGELTMGNLIGYTSAIRTGITGQTRAAFYKQENFWFRNGLAYQLPLTHLMFGRQASLRASYVFTQGAKDTMAFDQVHEVAVSLGIRTRESEQRTTRDLLRVGLLYTHAKNEYFQNANYDSLTVTVGYRF